MAVLVRRAGLALRERQELVAHVEERHAGHASTQLELEDAAVELDCLVHVADVSATWLMPTIRAMAEA